MKCPLESKSKCKRKKLGLEMTLMEPSPVEGWGEVDEGKVSNHYKSEFVLSIIVSLFSIR